MSENPGEAHQRQQQALSEALRTLLEPLARLAVARGVPYSAVAEILKRAFVDEAGRAHPGLLPHRRTSRISTVTGINRREVTRMLQDAPPVRPRGRSLVNELYAHWLMDPIYRDAWGRPAPLRRQGPAPSFESLAQAITRDVHPRSLLDEMIRLQLARLDEADDIVHAASFAVPRGDTERMLGLLGDNVGDHLRATVHNVLGEQPEHFEEAIFAQNLSTATVEWARRRIFDLWRETLATLVPELERRIDADAELLPPPDRRLRVGVYTYHEAQAAPATPDPKDDDA